MLSAGDKYTMLHIYYHKMKKKTMNMDKSKFHQVCSTVENSHFKYQNLLQSNECVFVVSVVNIIWYPFESHLQQKIENSTFRRHGFSSEPRVHFHNLYGEPIKFQKINKWNTYTYVPESWERKCELWCDTHWKWKKTRQTHRQQSMREWKRMRASETDKKVRRIS